ncbi:MAG: response regulator [Candidatus Omnitrophica bacterium]|nr:response regulator [Candidatus Omnitrophota bacterium]
MNKKILVVDDEVDVVTLIKFTLETNGFEVITAYDGEQALIKAQECVPDLILLDVLMPKMFGNEVLLELKKKPNTAKAPVIFLTNIPAMFLVEKEEEGLQRDAQGNIFLSKCCSEEELLSTIEKVLDIEKNPEKES